MCQLCRSSKTLCSAIPLYSPVRARPASSLNSVMADSLLAGANGCHDQGILEVVVAPGLFSSSVRLFSCPRLGARPSHHQALPHHLQPQHVHFAEMSIWTNICRWHGSRVAKKLFLAISAEIRKLLMVVTWPLLLQDCVLHTTK